MNMEPFDNRFDRRVPAKADVNRKLLAACRAAMSFIGSSHRHTSQRQMNDLLHQINEAITEAERVQN
jgi:hypothetical protein